MAANPQISPRKRKPELTRTAHQDHDRALKAFRSFQTPNKENEPPNDQVELTPQEVKAREVTSHCEKLQDERKSNQRIFDEAFTDMQALCHRVERLETIFLVTSKPNIMIGKARFRDELLQKLEKTKAINRTKDSEDHDLSMPDLPANREDFSASTRSDRFAGWFTRDTFNQYLANRDLEKLSSSFSLIKNTELRDARNAQTHETFYKVFAYTMVEGALIGNKVYDLFIQANYEAFRWLYKCTWEEAHKAAKAERDT